MLISTTLSVYAVVSDKMFQSLDWVDVDFDTAAPHPLAPTRPSFNPSTGLMLISTWSGPSPPRIGGCFNPSTGLMLISTKVPAVVRFLSCCFNPSTGLMLISTLLVQ